MDDCFTEYTHVQSAEQGFCFSRRKIEKLEITAKIEGRKLKSNALHLVDETGGWSECSARVLNAIRTGAAKRQSEKLHGHSRRSTSPELPSYMPSFSHQTIPPCAEIYKRQTEPEFEVEIQFVLKHFPRFSAIHRVLDLAAFLQRSGPVTRRNWNLGSTETYQRKFCKIASVGSIFQEEGRRTPLQSRGIVPRTRSRTPREFLIHFRRPSERPRISFQITKLPAFAGSLNERWNGVVPDSFTG